MKAVLWPYRFDDMQVSWRDQYQWMVTGLLANGIEVKVHPGLKCMGLGSLPAYVPKEDNPADICVYNHAMPADLVGNVLQTDRNWFWKPTGPTPAHSAIDNLGYGPTLSIGYDRPAFEGYKCPGFTKIVEGWIKSRVCKWGNSLSTAEEPGDEDYWLVLGQCSGDSVVTRMDFGGYVGKLVSVVTELLRVDGRNVIVKLHPDMAGRDNSQPELVARTARQLSNLGSRVRVITRRCSVHPFLKSCRAVLLANSGSGLEAMMHGKPIIAWGKPEYHWVSYDLRHLCDLRRAITLDWFDRSLQWQWLSWFCNEFCFTDPTGAARAVRRLLG